MGVSAQSAAAAAAADDDDDVKSGSACRGNCYSQVFVLDIVPLRRQNSRLKVNRRRAAWLIFTHIRGQF